MTMIRSKRHREETANPDGNDDLPRFELARMMDKIEDKRSVEYQRYSWGELRMSINNLVNKVDGNNINKVIPELFRENLVRGQGLFCKACIESQMASPGFTDVIAALVAVVNAKFPKIGHLLLRRVILKFKQAYNEPRNDDNKPQLMATVKFIAHLVNQKVAHEAVALELLAVLLEQRNTDDESVEVAVDFVKECGFILQDLCPRALQGIFGCFRGILRKGEINKDVQFLIEGLFALRKEKFQGHPAVRPELDLVEPKDQLTHQVSLTDDIDPEIRLDLFGRDLIFLENERRYEALKKSILREYQLEDEDITDDVKEHKAQDIDLRRTIYLTIMSSVDFEEAWQKLRKIELEKGKEMEICIMLFECCSQERKYLRYYGLLGQRFCKLSKTYMENFDKCFVKLYSMTYRFETNKLRNVAKFFAHLISMDALTRHALVYLSLTEEGITYSPSARIFIKILFQELSEHLGIRVVNGPATEYSIESIFPRGDLRNTRLSIKSSTSTGHGGIMKNLRVYLKNLSQMMMEQQRSKSEDESDSGSGSGSGSESSGSSDSESGSDSSSSYDSDSRSARYIKLRRMY